MFTMKIETAHDSEKQAHMLKLLQFGTVMVFVDSRHPGVIVPEHLKDDYQLRLNFDYAYEVDDFRVLPEGLEASLSFNRKNFFCVIPFNAVYLMISHTIQHGTLFTRSVPVEMLEYFASDARREERRAFAGAFKSHPFTVIRNEENLSRQDSGPSEQKMQRSKGHLRLVK